MWCGRLAQGGGLSSGVLRRPPRPSVGEPETGPKKADRSLDEVCEELNNVVLRHGIEDIADVVVRALPDQIVRPPYKGKRFVPCRMRQ